MRVYVVIVVVAQVFDDGLSHDGVGSRYEESQLCFGFLGRLLVSRSLYFHFKSYPLFTKLVFIIHQLVQYKPQVIRVGNVFREVLAQREHREQ